MVVAAGAAAAKVLCVYDELSIKNAGYLACSPGVRIIATPLFSLLELYRCCPAAQMNSLEPKFEHVRQVNRVLSSASMN